MSFDTDAQEFEDARKASEESGAEAHFARCHVIASEKHSETSESKMKGRVVLGGDRLKDAEGKAAFVAALGQAPASANYFVRAPGEGSAPSAQNPKDLHQMVATFSEVP